MRRFTMLAAAGSLACAAALTAAIAPQSMAATGPAGSAYAVKAETSVLNSIDATVGPVPKVSYPAGADKSVVTLDLLRQGQVLAKALNASSQFNGGVLTSQASIAELEIKGLLSAKLVTASCTAGRAGGAGHSSLVELNVLGQKIDVSVHKEITIGGVVTVRLDEQIKTGDTLTVNAVHVIIGGQLGQLASADVVLSQAVCTGVPGGSTPPSGTTGPPTSSQPGGPTSSSTPASTSSSTAAPASSTPAGAPGDKPGNGGNLAKTGVSAVLPLSIAGLVLLAIGAISVLLVRRRRVRA